MTQHAAFVRRLRRTSIQQLQRVPDAPAPAAAPGFARHIGARVSWTRLYISLSLTLFAGAVVPLLDHANELSVDVVQGDPIMQALLLLVEAIALLLLIRRPRRFGRELQQLGWLCPLLLLASLSLVWSQDSAITLRRVIALVGSSLFGLYIGLRLSLDEQLKVLGRTLAVLLILSVLFALLLPQYGIESGQVAAGWQGVFQTKNVLGRFASLAAIAFFLQSMAVGQGPQWANRCWVVVAVFVLVFSHSVTGLLVTGVFTLIFPTLRLLRLRNKLAVPALLFVCAVSASLIAFLVEYYTVALGMLDRNTTLTGRAKLWALVFDAIAHRPWLGAGYGAFWLGWQGDSGAIWSQVTWEPPHSHNGFLDLWLELGILGISLFLVGYGVSIRRAIVRVRAESTTVSQWAILFLIFYFLYNFTESSLVRQNSVFWVLYVAVVVQLNARKQGVPRSALAEQAPQTAVARGRTGQIRARRLMTG